MVFLVAYAWPVLNPGMAPGFARVCTATTVIIWLGFGVDYVIRVWLAASRWRFVRTHLFELLVLVLPLLRPLRALRLVTLLTVLERRAVASFRGRTLAYIVGAVVLMGFVAAVAVLDAERGSPGATITSFMDAVWWTAATLSSVGYGDAYPITDEGRFIGIGLMVGGIALLAAVTAVLASWFIEHVGSIEQAEAQTREEVAELATEVRALRQELADRSPEAGRGSG
jgi:voltage-gated potassium channel